MNIFSLTRLGTVLLALAGGAVAAPPSPPATLSLPQALELGLAQSPDLAASHALATAAAAQVSQAGSLPDPRLSLGLANLPTGSFSLDEDPMSQIQVGISQALPFPGKRGLQEAVARQQAAAADQNSVATRLTLVRDIKQAWWQLFYLDRALSTNADNRGLYAQLLETAQTGYTVGQGRQQDILLVQLELARLDAARLQLEQARDEQAIRLNRLLDRPPLTPVRLPDQAATPPPDLPDLPELPPTVPLEEGAGAQRPDLNVAEARLAAARAQRRLSAREQYPDFVVGAVYGRRDGREDLASLQFSMSLPLYAGRKQSRAEDQRQAELIAAAEALRALRSRAAAEIAAARLSYRRARDQVTLYRQSILPQAGQTVEVMLAGYQVNRTAFGDLVRAQSDLHDYQTQYWRAYSAAQQALAELAAAAGKEMIHE